jgi:hypothetical protein
VWTLKLLQKTTVIFFWRTKRIEFEVSTTAGKKGESWTVVDQKKEGSHAEYELSPTLLLPLNQYLYKANSSWTNIWRAAQHTRVSNLSPNMSTAWKLTNPQRNVTEPKVP